MELGILIAPAAGISSFFSPCMLPVAPAFVPYISGISIQEISKTNVSLKLTTARLNVLPQSSLGRSVVK